jgi:flagellar biosynthetic protein FlhB
MAGERTEKATPKKRDDSRKKGQVAKSMDLSGAVVLLAGIMALSAFAPGMIAAFEDSLRATFALVSSPEVVSKQGIGKLFGDLALHVVLAGAPALAICMIAGVLINLVQVGLKPSPQALKPQFKRLDPLGGAKKLFGVQHQVAETVKSVLKVTTISAVAYVTVKPELGDLAALVGMPPRAFLAEVAGTVLRVIQRTAIAYLFISFADYGWQRYRFEKEMRMEKKEVRDEGKQQELPAEVKMAQRRRAMEMSRNRMMDAVPTADVVVTNPTHYAVALKYDSEHMAPIVVAKGMDQLALRIRTAAQEAGVSIVPDPPLARSLHASVQVGQMIPEELYQAVAQLLAHVYRLASRKAVAA